MSVCLKAGILTQNMKDRKMRTPQRNKKGLLKVWLSWI